jgi:hypothetical protein
MYCVKCGKLIPDESKFCLNCGNLITQPSEPDFSDMPPQYLDQVNWNYDVPTVKNWGDVYRGFCSWFMLLDGSRNPTRASGKAKINIGELKVHLGKSDTYTSKYQQTFQVSKNDFRKITSAPYISGAIYHVEKPVFKDIGFLYRIEVWLETTDGRKLYGVS